ncbi:MAG TPA: proton-conducting transporter membrane subunit [Pirellulales bacterium]
MISALILVPFAFALTAMATTWSVGRRLALIGAALIHTVLTSLAWFNRPGPEFYDWLALDDPGLIVLTTVSVLFLASAIYSYGYLHTERPNRRQDIGEGFFFDADPESVFVGCMLCFLGSMTLVTVSQHFGLMWVAVEATTLSSAPLIYFHRNQRSLEATWKYLVICSVGIALALLGNFLLAVAASVTPAHTELILGNLIAHAKQLEPNWLQAAFIFTIVGYGVKMGLAPMHSVLPDADSEAPSAVAALLSGALPNCALLAILRCHQVLAAAGLEAFSQQLFVGFGLTSLAVAAIFIVRQTDFRRLLAYSSIEHVGIIAIGIGIGGAGTFAALLHCMNHACTKGALFLLAGNVYAAYGTRNIDGVRGLRRVLPWTGALWMCGFLAIVGSPPFGTFLSEFVILKAAFDGGRPWVGATYIALLAIIFIGMTYHVLRMTQGPAPADRVDRKQPDALWSFATPALLAALVLTLGVYIPPRLYATLDQAAKTVAQNDHQANPVQVASLGLRGSASLASHGSNLIAEPSRDAAAVAGAFPLRGGR